MRRKELTTGQVLMILAAGWGLLFVLHNGCHKKTPPKVYEWHHTPGVTP